MLRKVSLGKTCLQVLSCAIGAWMMSGPADAQLHRWTDAEGRVHYSNVGAPAHAKRLDDRDAQPAPGVRPAATAQPAQPAVAAPTASSAEPVSRAAAGGKPPRVVLYATSWCPYCEKARRFFQARGIEFTEHDIEQSSQARAAFRELGGRGVPLIVVGYEAYKGFNEQTIAAALDAEVRKP